MNGFTQAPQLTREKAMSREAIRALVHTVAEDPTAKPAPRRWVAPACLGFREGCRF
jgi:hypothetical protein